MDCGPLARWNCIYLQILEPLFHRARLGLMPILAITLILFTRRRNTKGILWQTIFSMINILTLACLMILIVDSNVRLLGSYHSAR